MEASRYFERTLFYDCSTVGNEHYEMSAQHIFETDPLETRIAVSLQSRNDGTEPGGAKDTSGSAVNKSRDMFPKGRYKTSSYGHGHNTSGDEADNCSMLSEASSTALSIAMDHRQADSGPPLYPGPPKLLVGDIGHGEIEDFAKRTKNDFRVFYLRQRHSFGRLHITRADFETLVQSCHVFPRFTEYVIGFARKSSEPEVGPPPLKFRPLYTDHRNGYRGFGKCMAKLLL